MWQRYTYTLSPLTDRCCKGRKRNDEFSGYFIPDPVLETIEYTIVREDLTNTICNTVHHVTELYTKKYTARKKQYVQSRSYLNSEDQLNETLEFAPVEISPQSSTRRRPKVLCLPTHTAAPSPLGHPVRVPGYVLSTRPSRFVRQ